MKKKLVLLLLLCSCSLTACNKEKIEGISTGDVEVMKEALEINGYQAISDNEMTEHEDLLGFEGDSLITPKYFCIAGQQYSPADFATIEDLYNTLEVISSTTWLCNNESYTSLYREGNTADQFQAAVTASSEECSFYFAPNSVSESDLVDIPGLLGIRIIKQGSDVRDVYAEFYGIPTENFDGVILVYEDQQLNVVKTGDSGLSDMPIAHYEVEQVVPEGSEIIEVPLENFEIPVEESGLEPDTAMPETPAVNENGDYTGVTYIDVNNAGVHAVDITSVESACDALLRMCHNMRMEYGASEETLQMGSASLMASDLFVIVEEQGELICHFYEFAGGSCRITAKVTPLEVTITCYPTGEGTTTGTSVCYDTEDYVRYIPVEHNHEMKVTFNN